MFRDTYKSAMDDIKPDSDLLGTILSHADEKKRTASARKWIYSVGACAASFLLVTCSVIGYNRYCGVNELPSVVSETADKNRAADDSRNVNGTRDLSSEIQQDISSKDVSEEISKKSKDENKVNSSTAEKRQSGDKTNEKTLEKSETPQKSETNEKTAETENDGAGAAADSAAAESAETIADTAQPDMPMIFAAPADAQAGDGSSAKKAVTDEGAYVQSENVGGAGGGSSRSAALNPMTVSQYAEYIGINAAEYLPSGFVYSGEDTLYVGSDGSATQFFSSNDGRTVSVTLTKDCYGMKNAVETSESERLTDTAVCDEYDDGCTAYGYGSTVGYIISGNLTKNEMKWLAESISK